MTEPTELVLRPQREGAPRSLAVPVGLLVVGLLTQDAFITLVTTMWSIFAVTGVLVTRIVLDVDGITVRPSRRHSHATWRDVQAVYIDRGSFRGRSLTVETPELMVRLPPPPGFFRTDEKRLAEQLRVVDAWWHAHRGTGWKRAKGWKPRHDLPGTSGRR